MSYPVLDAATEADVERKTAIQAYHSPLQLGGKGTTVQIDESLFCHKPKVGIMWEILHK